MERRVGRVIVLSLFIIKCKPHANLARTDFLLIIQSKILNPLLTRPFYVLSNIALSAFFAHTAIIARI